MIVVVAPVLARPWNAGPLADSLAAASPDVRLLFVVSPDDDAQREACARTGADILTATWGPGPGDFARKINLAYRETTERFIFQAADDVRFEPGWADEALRVAEDTGAGVTGTNDMANPLVKRGGHSTHSLIRRSYVDSPGASADGPGSVFSEAYGHQWCDNELVELAKARGQWAFAARAVVRHRHPIFDRTVPRDATYERGDLSAREDAALFRQRRRLWSATLRTSR